MKIVTKIILLIIISVTSIMGYVGYLSVHKTQQVLYDHTNRLFAHNLDFVEHEIVHHIEEVKRAAEAISYNSNISRALHLQTSLGINEVLNEAITIYPFFNYIMVVEANGDIFAVSTRDRYGNKIAGEQLLGKNVKENPMFSEFISSNTTTISSPGIDPYMSIIELKKEISQWYMLPLKKNDILIGRLVISYDWHSTLNHFFLHSTQKLLEQGNLISDAVLVDEKNNIIISTNPDDEGRQFSSSPDKIYKDRLITFGKITKKIIISGDKNKINEPVVRIRNFLIIIIISSSILLVIILLFILYKTFLQKINMLYLGTQKLRSGHLDYRLPIMGDDELGILAKNLNLTAQLLKKTLGDLLKNQEILEKKTQQLITGEQQLKAANQQLAANEQQLRAVNQQLTANEQQLKAVNQALTIREEELSNILSAISYPLYVINVNDFVITRMNPAAERLTTTTTDTIITCHKISHHRDTPCAGDTDPCPIELIKADKTSVILEHTHFDEQGNKKYINVHAFPIFDQNGNISQIVESHIDITGQKKAVEEKIRMTRELSRAQKMESIGTLAAGIAHEINTPSQFIGDNTRFVSDALASIFQVIQKYKGLFVNDNNKDLEILIAEGKKISMDADLEYYEKEIPLALNQTQEGIERITTIVRAMKDFSHMGSDSKSKENINKAIESTVIISRNEWKYVAELNTEFEPELPLVDCIIGDIKQVILNLIVNAAHSISDVLKSRGEKMGKITIKTYRKGEKVSIAINDTGMGIPEEIQDKVFDPFFTTKEVGRGTGQGLSIAYQVIVEKHKGWIWFETEVGKGTTFFIQLPLLKADNEV
ncbi:MAG: ATP-binding protein [bacterium]